MQRTSILLPPELRNRADQRARQLGISFGELVRRALDAMLETSPAPGTDDPFHADRAVFDGGAPSDASSRHDDHLYGRSS